MTHDRTSWQIRDEQVLDELVALMALTPAEAALLAAGQAVAAVVAPRLAGAFYGRLEAHPETAEYLRETNMAARHQLIGQWFNELFSGCYDRDYARRRLRVGEVHVKIGLPVRYPLAMLDVVMAAGEVVARQSDDPAAALVAFRKLLALDVAIFNHAYEDAQLRHLADLVGGERLARRLLMGQG